jgi:hypothetical protein
MKKTFIIVFLLSSLFVNNYCVSQWSKSNKIKTSTINNSTFNFISINSNLFAATYYGVFLSTDNGLNWTQRSNGINYPVKTITSIGSTILFAGTLGYVYRSLNNGVNWSQMDTGLTHNGVNAFAVIGTNIFAGTTHSGVYKSTDFGANWSAVNNGLPATGWISTLAAKDSNLFVNTTGGVYLSTDLGANWTWKSLNADVRCFAFSGNNIYAGTYGNGLWLSTNNGTSWSTVNFYWGTQITALFASGSNLFAGTEDATGVFLSTNNGTSWIAKSQGFGNVIPDISTLFAANNYIYAGVYDTVIWRRSYQDIIGINNISSSVPSAYSLSQNYPNPFNPTTTIKFDIAKNGNATIKIFDILGKEIATIVNEKLNAGTYTVDWNASDFPSEVYFYRLQTEGYTETKRMTLIK